MKTLKLEIEYDYDFLLYGLITAHKEYTVAWMLNQLLSLDLIFSEDIKLEFKKDKSLSIGNYTYETDYLSFRLLVNKSVKSVGISKNYLIPELKEYDYFLMINGDDDILKRQNLKEPLKENDFFDFVNEINVESLRSKENLIF